MTCLSVLALFCGFLAHHLRRYTNRISLCIWREQANRALGNTAARFWDGLKRG